MKWQIGSGSELSHVTIPDRVIDSEAFDATVNGVAYRGRWARSLGTLYLTRKDGNGVEAAYRIRNATVSHFSGENAFGLTLEYGAATKTRVQNLVVQGEMDVPAQALRTKVQNAGSALVRSPMSGKVLQVFVADGASVKKGDIIVIVEAMKMENRIAAPLSGALKKLNVKTGDNVSTGDALFEVNAGPHHEKREP